jgi:hypothetical protein
LEATEEAILFSSKSHQAHRRAQEQGERCRLPILSFDLFDCLICLFDFIGPFSILAFVCRLFVCTQLVSTP